MGQPFLSRPNIAQTPVALLQALAERSPRQITAQITNSDSTKIPPVRPAMDQGFHAGFRPATGKKLAAPDCRPNRKSGLSHAGNRVRDGRSGKVAPNGCAEVEILTKRAC